MFLKVSTLFSLGGIFKQLICRQKKNRLKIPSKRNFAGNFYFVVAPGEKISFREKYFSKKSSATVFCCLNLSGIFSNLLRVEATVVQLVEQLSSTHEVRSSILTVYIEHASTNHNLDETDKKGKDGIAHL